MPALEYSLLFDRLEAYSRPRLHGVAASISARWTTAAPASSTAMASLTLRLGLRRQPRLGRLYLWSRNVLG